MRKLAIWLIRSPDLDNRGKVHGSYWHFHDVWYIVSPSFFGLDMLYLAFRGVEGTSRAFTLNVVVGALKKRLVCRNVAELQSQLAKKTRNLCRCCRVTINRAHYSLSKDVGSLMHEGLRSAASSE